MKILIWSNGIDGTCLPVDEEGGEDERSESKMDEVVWRMSARDLIVVRGVVVEAHLVHCCTLSLCYLGAETDDHHRNPNIKNKGHLVGY